jgi:arylsulfatase
MSSDQPKPKPNIILIMSDQQRADTIGAWNCPYVITPNLDKLVQNGISFRNAFVPGATCIASRAATFTGMWGHNTGVYSFDRWAHHRNWIQDFAESGYRCVNIGKMHLSPRDELCGFHERIIVENPTSPFLQRGDTDDDWGKYLASHGHDRPIDRHISDPDWFKKFQGVPWHLEEHLHSDVFIGNSAVGWINKHKGDQPLFLQIGFTGPHEPYDPLPRHLEKYKDIKTPPARFKEGELKTKPIQQLMHQENFHSMHDRESMVRIRDATPSDIDHLRKHYYAKITTVDEQIGRVMAALEEKGLLKDSIIVFFSDHGDMIGDHQLPYKWLMYDSVVRVPLILWDRRQKSTPHQVQDIVSLMDLGPTLLDAAGIETSAHLEGKSLMPYSRGESPQPSRYVFCEDNYMVMIRSKTHKLVLYLGQEDGELYDLQKDPDEFDNLWSSPAHAQIKNELKIELGAWFMNSCYQNAGYKTRKGKKYQMKHPSTGPYFTAIKGEKGSRTGMTKLAK